MGTRAIYTFKDDTDTFQIYKHWDNYPKGASGFIEGAKEFAFNLPRFEADEFACAFIAANKGKDGGNIRLLNSSDMPREEYRYDIYMKDKILCVDAYDTYTSEEDKLIFSGSLDEFKNFEE